MPSKPKKRMLRLDVADKDLKGIGLGETVTVLVKGKVTELEASRKTEFGPYDKETWPARLELELSSVEIDGGNAYEKMAMEDMAETDGE